MKAIQTVIITFTGFGENKIEFFNVEGKRQVIENPPKMNEIIENLSEVYSSIKEPIDLVLEKELELNEKEIYLTEREHTLEEQKTETANQLHNARVTLEELLTEDQLENFLFLYDEWKVETEYFIGDKISYNNKLYSVIQPHTSQENWIPENSPSLFKRAVSDNIIQDWYQPAGAHDAFNEGDLVLFEDRVYQVRDGNYAVSWSPFVTPALWEDLGTLEEYNHPKDPLPEPDGSEGLLDPIELEMPGSVANPYTYAAYNGIPHGQEGSQGIYNRGEHVLFNNILYKSLIDNNTWTPDAHPAGWEQIQ